MCVGLDRLKLASQQKANPPRVCSPKCQICKVFTCLCFITFIVNKSVSSETITKEDWEQHVKDHTEKVKEIEEKYNTKLTKAEVCWTQKQSFSLFLALNQ